MFKIFRMGVKPKLQGKSCFLLLVFALFCFPYVVLGQGKNKNKNGDSSLEIARSYVLSGKFSKAIPVYALLVKKDSTNAVLTAEYAYALALDGIYDAALSRLDRVWASNKQKPEVNFYTSQVFALMGCDQIAGELLKEQSGDAAPGWISSKSAEFLKKYSYPSANSREVEEDVAAEFKRANILTARNYDLQALALFEEIISKYPDEYLPYVGYSIALEQEGMYDRSVQAMEKALTVMPDTPDNTEARDLLKQRIVSVNEKNVSVEKKKLVPGTVEKITSDASKGSGRYTAYAGGTISKSYFGLSARFGTYKPGIGSTSIDLGLNSSGLTLGGTTYFRKKIFVGGVGLVAGLSGSSVSLGTKVSLGISLMSKDRKASWDIFLDGQQTILPANSGATMCLSMGRSVYFGKR